jgi:membrane associated rhomboid family serine protease
MERQRAINLPTSVLALAVVFAGVHLVRMALSPASEEQLLLTFAFTPARYGPVGAMLPGGEAARFWTPVTYAFLHADWGHLLVNVVWMASFGGALARRFGAARFLLLSLVSAIAGAAMHAATNWNDVALVIGASGAVSGMMAGTVRFAFSPGGPLTRGPYRSFDNPAEPLWRLVRNGRAMWFLAVWFVANFAFGMIGMGPDSSGPIAWEAHVGGFLAGWLLFPLLDPVRHPTLPPADPAEGEVGDET